MPIYKFGFILLGYSYILFSLFTYITFLITYLKITMSLIILHFWNSALDLYAVIFQNDVMSFLSAVTGKLLSTNREDAEGKINTSAVGRICFSYKYASYFQ